MIFWQRPTKKHLKIGLLNMNPMPVIKKDNIPCTSSAIKYICENCQKKTQWNHIGGDEIVDNFHFDDDLKCAICSEIYIEATTLNCSHTFCKYCINRWRETNTECPICRSEIEFQVHTLVLDQIIDKILKSKSQDVQNQRNCVIIERRKDLNIRRQYVQKPVQTFQCNAQIGEMNIWGSLFEAINDEEENSSRQEDDFTQCDWIAYDPGSSTDEYEEYCVYTDRNCY